MLDNKLQHNFSSFSFPTVKQISEETVKTLSLNPKILKTKTEKSKYKMTNDVLTKQ